MKTTIPNNLEEGKPIQPLSFEIEAISEDSIKYIIKISTIEDKLTLSTSYKKGLLCKQYFSSHDLSKIQENKNLTFKNIHEYILFLKDILESNKLLKLENKIKNVEDGLSLEIPVRLGIIKEIKFEIKEKELTEKENQKNLLDYVNKLYLEKEELKDQLNELKLENDNIKKKLEDTQKNIELEGVKKIERIKNLFKDSSIVKNNEKK